MANIVYEDRMYNEQIKMKFIDSYSTGTKKILNRIFKITQPSETDLDKDLFDFNREELRRVFFLFMAKTEYSSRANVTWVSKYIDWAIEEGYLDGINPLDSVDTIWKEQFVNKSIKKYWTDNEIYKIIADRVNAQDAVIVSLLFNGVRGIGNSEIVNLMRNDVDSFNKTLYLTDATESRRCIQVSEQCIKLCEQALNEDGYEKKNGNASPDIKSPTANLVDNDFVVKSVKTRTEHIYEAEKNIVHRRLANIAEEINEPNFSPMNIIYSGMLAMAKNIYIERGELKEEELFDVYKQFNETSEQSIYRLKNEFLNLYTIKQLYKIP